jgi:hypothetical protein
MHSLLIITMYQSYELYVPKFSVIAYWQKKKQLPYREILMYKKQCFSRKSENFEMFLPKHPIIAKSQGTVLWIKVLCASLDQEAGAPFPFSKICHVSSPIVRARDVSARSARTEMTIVTDWWNSTIWRLHNHSDPDHKLITITVHQPSEDEGYPSFWIPPPRYRDSPSSNLILWNSYEIIRHRQLLGVCIMHMRDLPLMTMISPMNKEATCTVRTCMILVKPLPLGGTHTNRICIS